MAEKKQDSICPNCDSNNVAVIIYGLPIMSEELEQDLEEGRIVLGGCCITGAEPGWHCNDCGCEFGTNPETEEILNAIFSPEE